MMSPAPVRELETPAEYEGRPPKQKKGFDVVHLLKGAGVVFLMVQMWNMNFASTKASTILSMEEVLGPKRKLDGTKPGLRNGDRRNDYSGGSDFDLQGVREMDDNEDLDVWKERIVTFVDTRKSLLQRRPDNDEQRRQIAQYKVDKPIAEKQFPKKSLNEWRIEYLHACQDDQVDGSEVLHMAQNFYHPGLTATIPDSESSTPTTIEQCKFTFLDLGSNVGDSLGKFIDSGWDPCGKPGAEYKYAPQYNITEGRITQFHEKDNPLVRFARHFLRKGGKVGPPRYPDTFCFYGLEGNPVFTQRLKALETQIMTANPRPVHKVHFFTETVGAGKDGPTMLYLDTVSHDKNYWGSSVLTQPKYVQESAKKDNNGEPIGVQVQGMTLSTLVEKTTLREEGAHLMIKVDIEGGEFALFQEVHRSGVLCDYAGRGVLVRILVEKHGPQFEQAGLDNALWEKYIQDLTECGVVFQMGGSAG